MKLFKKEHGVALIEVLIALAIISTLIITIYTGVMTGVKSIAGNKNLTKAMLIARNETVNFRLNSMRGTDLKKEQVKEYPGFYLTRTTKRFEHPIFGPLDALQTVFTVNWQEGKTERDYSLTYIYAK